MNPKITSRFTFNCYKHHLGFLNRQIDTWKNCEEETVKSELIQIGENLIDMYIGKLSVDEIYKGCESILNKQKINNRELFLRWIGPDKYRKIKLSDLSEWILMPGKEEQKYIHIHPAKKSPGTVRVRASTLKTVVALEFSGIELCTNETELLNKVNHIRSGLLALSPIKSLNQQIGILNFWKIFKKFREDQPLA